MAEKAGVRDHEFVRFPNWDVNKHDVGGRRDDLAGKVRESKQFVLSDAGKGIYAFNTNGYFKYWDDLDYGKFTKAKGHDLYVRVEYPGWYFVQGYDSYGNDLNRVQEVNTPIALIAKIAERYGTNNQFAAFNTQSYIKRKVTHPLTYLKSLGPLHGLYIRTEFMDYRFFPNLDQLGKDIFQAPEAKDDVPGLIRICDTTRGAVGFNTNGWIKSKINFPLQDRPPGLSNPYQGTYMKRDAISFVYLPGFDSPGNDIGQLQGQELSQMIETCRNDPTAVALNTHGWLKRDLADEPVESPGADTLHGIYVKFESLEVMTMAHLAASCFLLKGTGALWSIWMIDDTKVRVAYQKGIRLMIDEIIFEVKAERKSITAAVWEASSYRNIFMLAAQNIGSPSGVYMAKAIKPAGREISELLERYTKELTDGKKIFRELEADEKNKVLGNMINAAGCDNMEVTEKLRQGNLICKGVLTISVAMSEYSVTVAPNWRAELECQVFSWVKDIVGGRLGAGVGTLVGGPVGAIMGGIAGSILGSLVGDDIAQSLAQWFHGGSSSRSAAELLDSALNPTSELVAEKLRTSGKGYYTHYVRAVHVSGCSSRNIAEAGPMVEEMVNDVPSETSAGTHADSEILATIVWVSSSGRNFPFNGANAADLWQLMEYVVENLRT